MVAVCVFPCLFGLISRPIYRHLVPSKQMLFSWSHNRCGRLRGKTYWLPLLQVLTRFICCRWKLTACDFLQMLINSFVFLYPGVIPAIRTCALDPVCHCNPLVLKYYTRGFLFSVRRGRNTLFWARYAAYINFAYTVYCNYITGGYRDPSK